MQRRVLLKLGLVGGATVAVLGAAVAWVHPAWREGRLTSHGSEVLRALAVAVVGDALPMAGAGRDLALAAHIERVERTIAGLPPLLRGELVDLLTLLASAPGRHFLFGLSTAWPLASPAQIQAALQDMRTSSMVLRRQAYHGLRDLTIAAYYSDPAAWAWLGYEGPMLV